MSEQCPCCGQELNEPTTAALLVRWCNENGRIVSADGAVDEETAALICELSRATMTNRRALGQPPVYHRRAGRVRYRLVDLAAFLDSGRIDW